jgi:pimeloyl-ACP methyl ester carboxylesterase
MELKSSFVQVDSLKMHLREQGDGPLVILCHGFPETGFSWRHQLSALGQAGYHAVAPDQRGYGQTDRPANQDSYTLCHLAGDIVGLVYALGERQATIVGHDWGAAVAWTCALLRPDIFRAVALLSVPYLADIWSDPTPTRAMRQMLAAGQMFYQLYFQEPGQADAELATDVRKSLSGLFYSLSGGISAEHRWRFMFSPDEEFRDTLTVPDRLPPWLTEEDLSVFVKDFKRTGFTGGLNWYRNLDRDRELLAFLAKSKVQQPALFLAGSEDAIVTIYHAAFNSLEETMPNLTSKILISSAGHWVQQEKPKEVNEHLLQFLSAAWPSGGGRNS